ncbi:MAG: sugar transferase [Frankiaceae bacterium]|nr:sugar transferase [Frankiaceae bacterium]MBV9870266.1 sugar transferase [Frankiaceae bacterium]
MQQRLTVAPSQLPTDQRHAATRKRVLDVVVASALTLLTAPLVLVLAIGVAITLRAWPVFSHWRIGQHGRPIRVFKLRTLPTSTPPYADKFELQIEDLPLPWLCRVLRRTHIDELPQLWLVVAGKMSMVGPRPVQGPDIEPVPETFSALRSAIRPGCTGLWQISEASGGTATSAPEYDRFYIDKASVRFDLWILARTVGWMLCLIKPVTIDDIPRWVRGVGLASEGHEVSIDPRHKRHLVELVTQHVQALEDDASLASIGD